MIGDARGPFAVFHTTLFHIAVFWALVVAPGLAIAQPQLPKRLLWWDDPMIVEQVGLSDDQRAKMSQAFADYEERVGVLRRDGITRRPYLSALEAGDWEKAKAEAERWLASDQIPKRAMAELKLQVLPILSSEQRSKLQKHYPRLIRRPWNPSPHWAGRSPQKRDRRLRGKPPRHDPERRRGEPAEAP